MKGAVDENQGVEVDVLEAADVVRLVNKHADVERLALDPCHVVAVCCNCLPKTSSVSPPTELVRNGVAE